MKKRTEKKNNEFPVFVTQYLDNAKLSDSSRVAYVDRLHSVLTYISKRTGLAMQDINVETIETSFSIEEYCNQRKMDGYSNKTIENEVKTFSSMFNRIAGKEHFHSVIDMPEDMISDPNGMTDAEFDKYQIQILDALRKLIIENGRNCHRDVLILLLIYEMGLKVSECVGINLSDVQENYIRVNRGGLRKIEIPHNVRIEIDRYLQERQELLGDGEEIEGEPLLIGSHRSRLCTRSLEIIIKNAFGNETEMTPELLRKVSAAYRFKQTGSIEYVALYLGINSYAAEMIVGNIRKGEGYYIPIPS